MSTARKRDSFVAAALALGFGLTGYSQLRAQVLEQGDPAHKDKRAAPAAATIRRGPILSSDGKTLAESQAGYELGLNFGRVPQSAAFFSSLAGATGLATCDLARPTESGKGGRVWRDVFTPDQAYEIRQVKSDWGADGISLRPTTARAYPLAEAGAGVVGVLREGRGLCGIEASLDTLLSGSRLAKAGMNRHEAPSVELTIDSVLQVAAMEAVRRAVEENKAKAGCAVVIDPKTGDLLAIANWPSFDPDESWKPGADFNMATMGAYEPGSTFKTLVLATALDHGTVHLGDTITCVGSVAVGKRAVHCVAHNGSRAHGRVDLEAAIAKSCNVAASQWALGVGREDMLKFMNALGLFDPLEIGMPGRRAGSYVRDEYAQRLQCANFGIGQAFTAVPVNLAAAYASLGNDGVLMRPRLIKKADGKEVGLSSRGQVVQPETAHEVLHLMASVIEKDFGTGRDLRLPGYELAGKTGTAQKIGTSNGDYVANFVGFVPAQSPRAAVLVMIDSPSAGQYYGGVVAGPVFLDIAKAVVRRLRIPPAAGR
ncbi:MAG: penicillin-binding protein 2 [Fimbriimonadaceae bacterium]|nr:penicillin-binding protein 2 [Fimbriimonadaceae bacterium]QYK55287.1 MAG: penicillin-binding protein 2 [Fimbriimonadaceae bacterium]